MLEEALWIIDEARILEKPGLSEAMKNGQAALRDGVAYWAEGTGKTGIIAHLPFKKVAFTSVEEALKAAQATTVVAASVSTCIVLAAIAVQTRYLADKLDKVQETVEIISKEVHTQNMIYYMDKASEYFGHLGFARGLLGDRDLAHEISDIGAGLLVDMAVQRNKILSLLDNIIRLAQNSNLATLKHAELIVGFAIMILGILPFGIHLEYLLSARLGKLQLAEHILMDGASRYKLTAGVYKNLLNTWHAAFLKGELDDRKEVYLQIEAQAKDLFKANYEEALLQLPLGKRVAPFSIPMRHAAYIEA